MNEQQLTIGSPIEARCTKCRKNTKHKLLELSENTPEKVQCSICERQHKYRPPTAKHDPEAHQARQRKTAECKEWKRLEPNLVDTKPKAYSMASSYKPKMVITHPTFGLGIVSRVIGSGKVDILFEDGMKTMKCR